MLFRKRQTVLLSSITFKGIKIKLYDNNRLEDVKTAEQILVALSHVTQSGSKDAQLLVDALNNVSLITRNYFSMIFKGDVPKLEPASDKLSLIQVCLNSR